MAGDILIVARHDPDAASGAVPRTGFAIVSAGVTLLDGNDFGLRLYQITVTYTPPNPLGAFSRIGMWARPVGGGDPQYMGEGAYAAGATHTAIFVMFPPPASTDYDLWMVPGTKTAMDPLNTSTSPHATFTLVPVPPGAAGQEHAAVVTGLQIVSHAGYYDANGVYRDRLQLAWTAPSDSRFAGVDIFEQKPGSVFVPHGRHIGNYAAQSAIIDTDFPPVSESHTMWVASVDKMGERNSLSGVCPNIAYTTGGTTGLLNLGKALAASVGPALGVVNNVLGVVETGITQQMIADFAVSKQKLANAPIIDAARIENLAVGTAHIQLLAIDNTLIANGAITTLKVGDAQITSAKIASLAAEKIAAGTIEAAIKMTSPWIHITGTTAIDIQAGVFSIVCGGMTTDLGSGGLTATSGTERCDVKSTGVVCFYGGSIVAELLTTGYGYLEHDMQVGGVFKQGNYSGITGTRTVKDGNGNNKDVTIRGGIITEWET